MKGNFFKGSAFEPLLVDGLFDSPVSFGAIMDEMPMGTVFLDSDRRIVFMSRALSALTGYDTDEVRGLPCYSVIRSNICLQQCGHANSSAGLFEGQANIVNRQKQKIPVKIVASPIVNQQGETIGFMEIFEDLRARQEKGWVRDISGRFENLVGKSPQMGKVFNILPMIAQSDAALLITGESGTGKDVMAEAVHLLSERAKGPFIKVNCAALPEILLDSELFGHQKGAFTGATENKAGRFRLAVNGTIYLSEVADLPLGLQRKLLGFLDDKVVYPVGSNQGVNVNVRIIAATQRPLEQLVRDGGFRSDFLFRLSGIRLQLPPLREREGDVRLLLEHMLDTFSRQCKKNVKGLSPEALSLLMGYTFPGNVRELKNIVEYAVSVCRSDTIQAHDLPDYLAVDDFRLDQPGGFSMAAGNSMKNIVPDARGTWMDTEKKMILEALVAAKGKKSQAAEILRWGRSTLWRKMKKYGLE